MPIAALAETLYAMKLSSTHDPPIKLARDLNLEGIINTFLKDPVFLAKGALGNDYRFTILLLFACYLRVAERYALLTLVLLHGLMT